MKILRLAFLFCCCFSLAWSGESSGKSEKISVTATGAPSSFVNHVNAIFGNLLFSTVDVSSPSPHSVPLVRYYNSNLVYCTWLHGLGMTTNYPLWIKGLHVGAEDDYAYMVAEEDGGSVVRCVSKFHLKNMRFYLDPETIHKGLTNTSGQISARTNLKNVHFEMEGHWKDSNKIGRHLKANWKAYLSDGGTREYCSTIDFESAMNLKSEHKPNGTNLSFDYRGDKEYLGYLKEIKSTNHSHQHTLGWLKIDYHHNKVEVESNTGREVSYSYDFFRDKKVGKAPYITKVRTTDRPVEEYSYHEAHGRHRLSKISYPDGRYLKIDYDHKGRVSEQRAPFGPNGTEITVYSFAYHPDDRKTVVCDAKDRKTMYKYSSRKRLTNVEKFTSGDGHNKRSKESLYRGEEFFWGKRESCHRGKRDDSDEGHLLARAIYDSRHKTVSCQRYSYDGHGNITEEALYGNLTGSCPKPFDVSDDGRPDHHVEQYRKEYSYSHDDFHLKTRQKEDDGPTIRYEYESGTDLMSAKFTCEGSRIKIREFFEYNSDAILVKKIIDNGSSEHPSHLTGVTERRITYIKPVRDDHGSGLPERITECYLDLSTRSEVQLRRTEYTYTKAGLVEKEKVYDADNRHRCTLHTSYDKKNRPIRKTDALGRETRFEYDDNCNKTREELVGSGCYTTFDYDLANRLVRQKEHYSDGMKLSTSYTYLSLIHI